MSKATAPSQHFADAVEIVTKVLKGNWPLAETIVRRLEPLRASEQAELLAALREAPIMSKYHGMHGFECDRFFTDYEAWRVVARAALAKAEERR